MNLDRLAYLCEIERMRSINAAAAKLHISHQALSRAVQNMEAELGVHILNRTPAGVSFTPQGEAVLAAARSICGTWDDLVHQIAGEDDLGRTVQQAPRMSYGATAAAYKTYLTQTLHVFRKQHPDVELLQQILPIDQIVSLLDGEAIEFAVISFMELDGTPLFQCPKGLAFSEAGRSRILVRS